jgi:hypothetical protein
MTNSIDFNSIDRLINDAGLGSFELNTNLVTAASAVRSGKTPPRAKQVSEDFLMDLDLAGRHIIRGISELVHSEKGIADLMFALDGTRTTERSIEASYALGEILRDFVKEAASLRFLPAVNSDQQDMAAEVNILPNDCSCAIDTELKTVYASADLGFRDLFRATQTAAIKSLMMRAEPLVGLNAPVQSFVTILNLLDSDTPNPAEDAMMKEISLVTADGNVVAYATSFRHDT